jgi:hypothetical protein
MPVDLHIETGIVFWKLIKTKSRLFAMPSEAKATTACGEPATDILYLDHDERV